MWVSSKRHKVAPTCREAINYFCVHSETERKQQQTYFSKAASQKDAFDLPPAEIWDILSSMRGFYGYEKHKQYFLLFVVYDKTWLRLNTGLFKERAQAKKKKQHNFTQV